MRNDDVKALIADIISSNNQGQYSDLYEYATTNALGEEGDVDLPSLGTPGLEPIGSDDPYYEATTNALGEEGGPEVPEGIIDDRMPTIDPYYEATTNALGEEGGPRVPDRFLDDDRPTLDPYDGPVATTNALGEEGDSDIRPGREDFLDGNVEFDPKGTIASPNLGTGPTPTLDTPKVMEPIECFGPKEGPDGVEWAITGALGEEATPIYPKEDHIRENDVAPTIEVKVLPPIECFGPEEPKLEIVECFGPEEPKVMPPIECFGPKEGPDGVEWAITGALGEEATPIYPQEPKVEVVECYGEKDVPYNDLPTWEPTIYLGDDFIITKRVEDMFDPQEFPDLFPKTEQDGMELLMTNAIEAEDVLSFGRDTLDTLLQKVTDKAETVQSHKGQEREGLVEFSDNMADIIPIDLDVI